MLSSKKNKSLKKLREEAKAIGKDSYSLLNFERLPLNASVSKQIEALRADRRWQEDHLVEISGRIDRLIQKLEEEHKLRP
jgi:hypothetical protein